MDFLLFVILSILIAFCSFVGGYWCGSGGADEDAEQAAAESKCAGRAEGHARAMYEVRQALKGIDGKE